MISDERKSTTILALNILIGVRLIVVLEIVNLHAWKLFS